MADLTSNYAVRIINHAALAAITSPDAWKAVTRPIETEVIVVRPAYEVSGLYQTSRPARKTTRVRTLNFSALVNLFRGVIKNG